MKNIFPILSLAWLLAACDLKIELPNGKANTTDKCPPSKVIALPKLRKNERFEQRFDFHIRQIQADNHTIKFQTREQDFIFCRANSTWTVQTGTLKKDVLSPKNYTEFAQEIVNPSYKNINLQGKIYKYRVVIEPKFRLEKGDQLSQPSVEPEKNQIVFELIGPDNKQPQRQTLYTLQDLQRKAKKSGYSATSVQLGIPRITASLTHANRLWWAIAFEQAEGNTGIATVVSYQPQADRFTVIQPQAIEWQQITDLAIAGQENNLTLWLGTKKSGEGNEYLPASGLVAYRLAADNLNWGAIAAYTVHNSPLVGAIPDKLRLEADTLWVGTGNGVCQVKWQVANDFDSWSCWRFAVMAQAPSQGVPLYSGLTDRTPAKTLSPSRGDTIEVLWWSPIDIQNRIGRYEVRSDRGFTVKLNQGVRLLEDKRFLPPGKPPVSWPGFEWHWQGYNAAFLQEGHFSRGFDEVATNEFGGGPQGITTDSYEPLRPLDWNAIRGDLELLQFSPKSTTIKYYSGWVDENLLQPYLQVIPQPRPLNSQVNPLTAIATQLVTNQKSDGGL